MARGETGGSSGEWGSLDEFCEPKAFRSVEKDAECAAPSIFVKGLLTVEGHFRTSLTCLKDSFGVWTLPVLFLSSGVFGGVVASVTFRARMSAIKNQARSPGPPRDASYTISRTQARLSSPLTLGITEHPGLPPRACRGDVAKVRAPVSSLLPRPSSPSSSVPLESAVSLMEQHHRLRRPCSQPSSKEQRGQTPEAGVTKPTCRTVHLPCEGELAAGGGVCASGKNDEGKQGVQLPDGGSHPHLVESSADPYTVLWHERRRNKKGWGDAFDDEEEFQGQPTAGSSSCPHPTELFTVSELVQLFLIPAAALTVALGCTWTWVKKSCNLADANDVFQAVLWVKGVGAPPAGVRQPDDKRSELLGISAQE
ncbi:conserved hypothetical protein [Neospora caninum Liverpool]|uniref:Transmembrane protein n=1 Tax=Neospora caninum (strain Liverpool) TaxID=572307 RepID=F0V9M4_NEOCL|nr:conserved hypothetical protein [Neospora caninum Liverpool]CBZ50450.1 conserved hypothetical protein [Neospora caninum Liverpool]CEL65059.1 TPA: hypothetical protein BN1204_009190 [Neospora caninum Liverpool]|eukprot:XP_003880483.1 conserved hypothetical protein [Neospora caninum Liverpool]